MRLQGLVLMDFRSRCYSADVVSPSLNFGFSARSARPGLLLRAFVLLCCCVSSAAFAATVEGQLFDRDGRGLGGVTIVLVERRPGLLQTIEGGPEENVLARARSDRQGFFKIEVREPLPSGRLFVRASSGDGWDRHRYAIPADIDVTLSLNRTRHAVATLVADSAPSWPGLEKAIERAGGITTERGRILRTHGLPPETQAMPGGRVIWRYPSATYVFDAKGALIETHAEGAARANAGSRGES